MTNKSVFRARELVNQNGEFFGASDAARQIAPQSWNVESRPATTGVRTGARSYPQEFPCDAPQGPLAV